MLLELQLWLNSSSKDATIAFPTPPLLCHAWSFSNLSTFTSILSKILSFIWLFGVTKVCNNLEELSKNLGCAFCSIPPPKLNLNKSLNLSLEIEICLWLVETGCIAH